MVTLPKNRLEALDAHAVVEIVETVFPTRGCTVFHLNRVRDFVQYVLYVEIIVQTRARAEYTRLVTFVSANHESRHGYKTRQSLRQFLGNRSQRLLARRRNGIEQEIGAHTPGGLLSVVKNQIPVLGPQSFGALGVWRLPLRVPHLCGLSIQQTKPGPFVEEWC